MSNTPHKCLVGYAQDYDYVQDLSEGDEIPQGATVWNYCPECGRRHGTADQVEQLWAAERERALAARPPIAPDPKIWERALEYVWAAKHARLRGLEPMAVAYEEHVRQLADRAIGVCP